ncbi:conserved protein of unknown function; Type III effector NopZ [Bradyrhizobium sp. ORS 285]|uniref:hypothetical protein n=1 Tax=Bradyrhizobium sp. ORS 285 TaxID=115808 RepID=UPI00024067BB|nr:hypothetical protein [Bradyrhizobium sp. ORS 285]CCD87189.1 conserved hypothetical protein, y4yJ-like protein [Bradyrhizobium sp. ORS 285]SMX56479.1 conserved protein of unknown function; Type III effector NopZ [Bradyrhizobium sp. ORS 285]
MDVALGRLNPGHASKLRLVKDKQERSAIRELSAMEAKHHLAMRATQEAFEHLAYAHDQRAKVEFELYREMLAADAISACELQRRHHLIIGRLTDKIEAAQRGVEEARAAQEQAEAAVRGARIVWTRCSAASQKWSEIDRDVQTRANAYFEAAAEKESDDEILPLYRRGTSGHTGGDAA